MVTIVKIYTCSFTLREKCLYLEFSWAVFSRIRTEYGEIRLISSYSIQMRDNTPYLSAFSPDVGKSSVSLRIQSKCGKIRTRKSPNTDTFRTVRIIDLLFFYLVSTNSVQKLPPITLHQYFNVKFVKLRNVIFLKIALNYLFLKLGGILSSNKIVSWRKEK